jgi:hypothetical protein
MGETAPAPEYTELVARLEGVMEPTRASARGLAAKAFGSHLRGACWHSLTFTVGEEIVEVQLAPDREYHRHLLAEPDVESFVAALRGMK